MANTYYTNSPKEFTKVRLRLSKLYTLNLGTIDKIEAKTLKDEIKQLEEKSESLLVPISEWTGGVEGFDYERGLPDDSN